MRIERLDRAALKALSAEITHALQEIASTYGVSLKVGNGTYDDRAGIGTLKIEIGLIVNGVPRTKQSADFELYTFSHGLAKTDLGRVFTGPRGAEMTIAGFIPRSGKILAQTADGKQYTIAAAYVLRTLYPNPAERPTTEARAQVVDDGLALMKKGGAE